MDTGSEFYKKIAIEVKKDSTSPSFHWHGFFDEKPIHMLQIDLAVWAEKYDMVFELCNNSYVDLKTSLDPYFNHLKTAIIFDPSVHTNGAVLLRSLGLNNLADIADTHEL